MKRSLAALGVCIVVAGCSKTPAKVDACGLLLLSEAQAVDAAIAQTQSFPPKQGEELCVFTDQAGEARLMLFVWRGKSSAPLDAVRSGMQASDRFVELGGVGTNAAAGFSASDENLKLLAAQAKGGMVGLRVRDPVKFGDEKFNNVKALAGRALDRLK